MAADIFTDICRFPKELEVGLPQRLQTSMSLYSNNLSGLVLLTDDAYMSLEGSKMTNEFNKLCTQSTEFHFPSFDQQLESIRNEHLEVSKLITVLYGAVYLNCIVLQQIHVHRQVCLEAFR